MIDTYPLGVAQESTVLASIDLISNESKHPRVEFKHCRHLYYQHSDQIKELDEYWASLLILVIFVVVTEPPCKHVSECEPILFN